MKNLVVKNYQTEQGQALDTNGARFTVKEIIPTAEATQLHANFVEVEPGNFAYSYHWHEINEEVFYIISGTAAVRTKNGEKVLKAGDAITFPAGPEGAHVIRNASETEKLVYLDFGHESALEIAHFADIGKVLVLGPTTKGMTDDVK
ncbi:MAG: cupin domain-containing protein [Elusimicrobiaceae bacterium]|nr:cupin domain-containing protein [Elusimicrobiaceae bacterium]